VCATHPLPALPSRVRRWAVFAHHPAPSPSPDALILEFLPLPNAEPARLLSPIRRPESSRRAYQVADGLTTAVPDQKPAQPKPSQATIAATAVTIFRIARLVRCPP